MEVEIWKKVFLEITLRALKKAHLNHTPWELGKKDLKTDDLLKLNDGFGVLLALETTVASEISNEFIYSSFTNGMKFTDQNNVTGAKYYEVEREVRFYSIPDNPFKNKKLVDKVYKQVDLILRRYDTDKEKHDALIIMELKRYCIYPFDIRTGKVDEAKKLKTDIQTDIKNLRIFKGHWDAILSHNTDLKQYKDHKKCYPHMLIWGEVDQKNASAMKKTLMDEYGILDEKDISFKWMPLKMGDSPNVTNWIWIALIAV